jgi:hypothetical protein
MAQQTAPTSATLSTVITNLDASPQVRSSGGQGAPARRVTAFGTAVITATQATTVATRLVRIPSNAIVKAVRIGVELNGVTITTLTGAVGLLFSDNANNLDGTASLNVNTLKPFSSACFCYQKAFAAILSMTDVTWDSVQNESSVTDGFYVPSASGAPIWQALTQGGPFPQAAGTWAGNGATTLSTSPSYQLTQDPGGFLDVFFQATTTTSMTGAVNMTCEVEYVEGL